MSSETLNSENIKNQKEEELIKRTTKPGMGSERRKRELTFIEHPLCARLGPLLCMHYIYISMYYIKYVNALHINIYCINIYIHEMHFY